MTRNVQVTKTSQFKQPFGAFTHVFPKKKALIAFPVQGRPAPCRGCRVSFSQSQGTKRGVWARVAAGSTTVPWSTQLNQKNRSLWCRPTLKVPVRGHWGVDPMSPPKWQTPNRLLTRRQKWYTELLKYLKF